MQPASPPRLTAADKAAARRLVGPRYLVGIDEAGYGPNLGPLAVAATAWRIDTDDSSDDDLYSLLRKAVSAEPAKRKIQIADSKAVYKPGKGLAGLEQAVLPALQLAGTPAAAWADLTARPGCSSVEDPTTTGFNPVLPIDLTAAQANATADRLAQGLQDAKVSLLAVALRLVFPAEFNRLVDHHGTKGAALSHVTLTLLADVLKGLPAEAGSSCRVTCDKHGGRNQYAALLQHHFPHAWVEVLDESRAVSRYRWDHQGQTRSVAFRAGGEAELPTALASMTAKYLRELAMRGFNAYWAERAPGVKPTAGYPADAKRFWADTAEARQATGIPDHQLWRSR
ncbi:MAG: hypothetical protein AAGA92_08020 [Planctomycetota bacterium]